MTDGTEMEMMELFSFGVLDKYDPLQPSRIKMVNPNVGKQPC